MNRQLRNYTIESDEGTYKIAFENERGTLKDVISPGNRWLAPNVYLRNLVSLRNLVRNLLRICVSM